MGSNSSAQNMPVVEMHPCFIFDCDECGVENLIRIINSVHGPLVAKLVRCSTCGSVYAVPDGPSGKDFIR